MGNPTVAALAGLRQPAQGEGLVPLPNPPNRRAFPQIGVPEQGNPGATIC